MMQFWLKMRFLSTEFGEDERGATAIEYGLIAAGIAIVIIAAIFAIGDELNNLFLGIANDVSLQEARCAEVGSNCGQ